MTFSDIAGYGAMGIISLMVGMLLDRWRASSRVVYYIGPHHVFSMEGDTGPFSVNSQTLHIQNLGRVMAKNVEIVFLFEPPSLNFQPRLNFQESKTKQGHHVLTLQSLGPKESVEIQVLYYDDIPQPLYVRSDSGQAKLLEAWLVQRLPDWVYRVLVIAAVVGAGVIGLTVIRLIFLAWENLPFPWP